MPVYDYRCAHCGREVEVSHGIHQAGPTTCDACGGPMRKALSAPAIHFKGSGWAKKDARSAAKSASTPTGPSAGAAEGPEGKKAATGESATGAGASAGSKDSAASGPTGGTTGGSAKSTSGGTS